MVGSLTVPIRPTTMQRVLKLLSRDVPIQVQISLFILWISTLISCIRSVTAAQDGTALGIAEQSSANLTGVFAIYYVGRAVVYLALVAGKNWAKNAVYVLAGLSVFGLTSLPTIIQFGGRSAGLWAVFFAGVDVAAAILIKKTKKSFWK